MIRWDNAGSMLSLKKRLDNANARQHTSAMDLCLNCRSNMLSGADHCAFCGVTAPEGLAARLKEHARKYMVRHQGDTYMRVGQRSQYKTLARTLQELCVLRLVQHHEGASLYTWTDYGRKVLENCLTAKAPALKLCACENY